jgi:hypothetical protein
MYKQSKGEKMKSLLKLLLLSLFYVNCLLAGEYVYLYKGWNLIGSNEGIDLEKTFDSDNIAIVWKFNNETKKWEAYSSNSEKKSKIENLGYDFIVNTNPYEGVWVYAKSSDVIKIYSVGNTIIDQGYSARDVAATFLYQILGNGYYYATDNKCVYPSSTHDKFKYEIFNNNTVNIKYSSYDYKKYSCNIIRKFKSVKPRDSEITADYITDSYPFSIYKDYNTKYYYRIEIEPLYGIYRKKSKIVKIIKDGEKVIVSNGEKSVEAVLLDVFVEVPLN